VKHQMGRRMSLREGLYQARAMAEGRERGMYLKEELGTLRGRGASFWANRLAETPFGAEIDKELERCL
jgi:hypothetical protein